MTFIGIFLNIYNARILVLVHKLKIESIIFLSLTIRTIYISNRLIHKVVGLFQTYMCVIRFSRRGNFILLYEVLKKYNFTFLKNIIFTY